MPVLDVLYINVDTDVRANGREQPIAPGTYDEFAVK